MRRVVLELRVLRVIKDSWVRWVFLEILDFLVF